MTKGNELQEQQQQLSLHHSLVIFVGNDTHLVNIVASKRTMSEN